MMKKSCITFPCEFKLKIVGKSDKTFENKVLGVFSQLNYEIKDTHITRRLSSHEQYLSLSVVIVAESQEKLDRLYKELSALPEVLWVL